MNSNKVPGASPPQSVRSAVGLLLSFDPHGRWTVGVKDWPQGNFLTDIVYEGHTGVALFLVLSGFLPARISLGKPVSYSQFIRNRASADFPVDDLSSSVRHLRQHSEHTIGNRCAVPVAFEHEPETFTDITDISGAVWTIAVEFQFYLIAPFIFAFVAERGLHYLAGLMLMAWIAKCIVLFTHLGSTEELYTISYFTIVGRLNQFFVGVGIALLLA